MMRVSKGSSRSPPEPERTLVAAGTHDEREQGLPIELVLWAVLLVIGLLSMKTEQQNERRAQVQLVPSEITAYGF